MEPNWDEVDAVLAELDKDDREGKQIVVVQEATWKQWDNGDRTRKLSLTIEGKGGKLYMDMPEKVIGKAEFEKESPGWDDRKRKGVRFSMHLRKALKEFYGVTDLDVIKEGFRFAAELKRDKPEPGRDLGYLKVRGIIPINAVKAGGTDVPVVTGGPNF